MSEYEILPEGYYEAVAVKTDADDGSSAFARMLLTKAENRQVGAHFKILDPPDGFNMRFPMAWYSAFSKTVIGAGTKNERSVAQMTVESLRAMGFKGNDLTQLSTQTLNQIVSVKVVHEEYQNKTKAKISFVNPFGGGTIKANVMSPDSIRQFASLMKDSLRKIPEVDGPRSGDHGGPPATSTQKSTHQEPPPQDDTEDDIPF